MHTKSFFHIFECQPQTTSTIGTTLYVGTNLTVSGDASITGTHSVTGTIRTSTGNVIVSAGNITCVRSQANANDGRITGSFGVFPAQLTASGQFRAGNSGGSVTPGVTNLIELYAEDGEFIMKTQAKPANSTDTGTAGEIRIADDNGTLYFYYCTAANTWVRTAFSTF